MKAPTLDPHRLAQGVRPLRQTVDLTIDPDRTDYHGTTHIALQVKEPVTGFRFHAEAMNLSRVMLLDPNGSRPLDTTPGEHGLITASCASSIAPGEYSLEIDFSRPFGTRAVALYRMEEGDRAYAFTQFEPDDARGAFPIWDEPIFKIPFQLTLRTPIEHMAVTNTPVSEENTEGNWRTTVFEPTPPLPSYLLAVAVGHFDSVPIPGLSVPGRVITPKGQSHLADTAIAMTPPLLAALETYFDRPYPYQKLDLIAVPEYWPGAMEHPGAITYSDAILLFDGARASALQRRQLAAVTAHELGHQWFGNLVTMAWWDDLWLNEAFTSWVTDKITAQVYPEFGTNLGCLEDCQGAMAQDALPSTQPIVREVLASDNIMATSIGLVYTKGKAVLNMFEHWLGEETFRQGVLHYLNAHAWGNATAADVWAALETSSGRGDIAGALQGFVRQPGIPLITAAVVGGPGSEQLELSQHRLDLVEPDTLSDERWHIPMVLRYARGGRTYRTQVLLQQEHQPVTLEGSGPLEWLLPNGDAHGYYRWHLAATWLDRTVQAREHHTTAEKIEVLGNAGALLLAGQLSGATYLALLESFSNESHPQIIAAVLNGLSAHTNPLIAEDCKSAFAAYIQRSLGPVLTRFGRDPVAGEDSRIALVRPRLITWLADHGRDQALLSWAREIASNLLEGSPSAGPSVTRTCLALSCIHGDRSHLEKTVAAFEHTPEPSLRRKILHAMGLFTDLEVANLALDYSLSGPLRAQEITQVATSMASRNENSKDRALAWVQENYDTIVERIPPSFAAFLPQFGGGSSLERVERARRFFLDPIRRTPALEERYQKVFDQVRVGARMRDREQEAVRKYLSGSR